MPEVQILSKEQLFERAKPREAVLELPELGDGAAIRVRGYTVSDMSEIHAYAHFEGPDGKLHYDGRNDKIYSILRAVAEPALTAADTERILGLADGIGDRIVAVALELSQRSDTSWEELKRFFRFNTYARRVYTVCAEVFHRLPSELSGVTEEEFNAALAALEVEAEVVQERMAKQAG